jgi:hypothetical protein
LISSKQAKPTGRLPQQDGLLHGFLAVN